MATLQVSGGTLARSGGKLVIITGLDEIAQKVAISIQLVLGEWFLNQNEGMPYYERIFIKNPNPGEITSIFRRAIMAVPGIRSVESLSVDFTAATRALSVSFVGRTITDERIDFSRAFDLFKLDKLGT
jgi:hypothetical protein